MQSISLFPPDTSPCPVRSITLDTQIAAVQRELAMRASVYPGQIARGRLTQTRADYQIAAMEAVLVTLVRLRDTQLASSREVYP